MNRPRFSALAFFLVLWFAVVTAGHAQSNITATLTFTNAAGITNGDSVTIGATTWQVTNSTTSLRYIAVTNTAAAGATNFFNKLSRALTNAYLFAWTADDTFTIHTIGNNDSLTISKSGTWGTLTVATNANGGARSGASNILANAFTLNGVSITNWNDISAAASGQSNHVAAGYGTTVVTNGADFTVAVDTNTIASTGYVATAISAAPFALQTSLVSTAAVLQADIDAKAGTNDLTTASNALVTAIGNAPFIARTNGSGTNITLNGSLSGTDQNGMGWLLSGTMIAGNYFTVTTNYINISSAAGYVQVEPLYIQGNQTTNNYVISGASAHGENISNSWKILSTGLIYTNTTGNITGTVNGAKFLLVTNGDMAATTNGVNASISAVSNALATSISSKYPLSGNPSNWLDSVALGTLYGLTEYDGVDPKTTLGIGSSAGVNSVALGDSAQSGSQGVAIGSAADASSGGVAVGSQAQSVIDSVALNTSAYGYQDSVAIGASSAATNSAVSIGNFSTAYERSIAIGTYSSATPSNSIAIGPGVWSDNTSGAKIPAGWDGTIELGAGTATLRGGLNIKGVGILTSNAVFTGNGAGLTNIPISTGISGLGSGVAGLLATATNTWPWGSGGGGTFDTNANYVVNGQFVFTNAVTVNGPFTNGGNMYIGGDLSFSNLVMNFGDSLLVSDGNSNVVALNLYSTNLSAGVFGRSGTNMWIGTNVSAGTQTPLGSDVNGAGYSITNLSRLLFSHTNIWVTTTNDYLLDLSKYSHFKAILSTNANFVFTNVGPDIEGKVLISMDTNGGWTTAFRVAGGLIRTNASLQATTNASATSILEFSADQDQASTNVLAWWPQDFKPYIALTNSLAGGGGGGGIAFDKFLGVYSTTTDTPYSLPVEQTVSAGETVYIGVWTGNDQGSGTLTDSQGNTYTFVTNSVGSHYLFAYKSTLSTGLTTSDTITMTWASPTYAYNDIFAFSISGATALDVSGVGSDANAATVTATATTTGSPSIAVGFVKSGDSSYSASNFGALTNFASAGGGTIYCVTNSLSAGSHDIGGTVTVFSGWNTIWSAFK